MEVPMDRREVLGKLALGLDNKSFLPSIGAVRHFLEMRGIQLSSVKRREDAFKTVLGVLREMPSERLSSYVTSMDHSGPADLATISDAIGRAGRNGSRDDSVSPDRDKSPSRDDPAGEARLEVRDAQS
jgi:hypothetical protein